MAQDLSNNRNHEATSHPTSLPKCHEDVFDVIWRRTKLNPITTAKLCEMYGVSDSTIRKIVHYYRFDLQFPIASRTTGGYWQARKLKEWRDTTHHLQSRAYSMLKGLDAVEKKWFSGQQGIQF